MTASTIQASITASFILVLIGQLSKEDQTKGSVVRVKERLISILRKQPKTVAILADNAYNEVRDAHINDTLELDIGIIIENLCFNKVDYMQELFGIDIDMLVSRASAKITLPNLTRQQGRDSYDISDELTKSLEKHTFNYLKENK